MSATASELRLPDAARASESIASIDWLATASDLNAYGNAILKGLLAPEECDSLSKLYQLDDMFRGRVVMARHGFGRGEYKYFKYPLPGFVDSFRSSAYEKLVPVANEWNRRMGVAVQFPPSHADFIERCHGAEQWRPTPLLLEYGPGDYNCLHQDLYGENVFPIQVTFLLSKPGQDFAGGEFVLTEQRPRMQTRAEVVPLRQGDAIAFAVHTRPVQGTRGDYRVNLRHGVSRLHSGRRHTLGVVFHDAK